MFHGQKLNAIAVNAVSSELEKVRVEQKNCHGLTAVRMSCTLHMLVSHLIRHFSRIPQVFPAWRIFFRALYKRLWCYEMSDLHTVVQADRLPAPYARWAHFQVK
jgi:hypothetical protein